MKVVIIGAGTAAMVVADILVQDRNFELSGFVGTAEEEAKLTGKKLYGDVPFIGDRRILTKLKDDNIVGFVPAIKNSFLREKAYYEATRSGLIPINAISRHAVIEPSVSIGKGVIICAGCIISHGVSIGNNTSLWPGVIININTRIGDNCFFSTGCIIGGECDVGRNTTFEMQSAVLPYLKVGKNQSIEPGRIVNELLPDLMREEF
ncbi:MAG: PglD-related sugar-binding protein [Planctomycetota bacterium]|jgi:carbonic anhydrase/acetyltransferase-like protein (isoleucine patch superfamily)